MMRRVHEYEAWSLPGGLLPSEYGKSLQDEVLAQGVPSDVFLGLSEIPDDADSEYLKLAIQDGDLSKDAFEAFCFSNGLIPKLMVAESAAKFLEFSHGRCLAWIHIPEDANPMLLAKIVDLLKIKNIKVLDPETGQSCD